MASKEFYVVELILCDLKTCLHSMRFLGFQFPISFCVTVYCNTVLELSDSKSVELYLCHSLMLEFAVHSIPIPLLLSSQPVVNVMAINFYSRILRIARNILRG